MSSVLTMISIKFESSVCAVWVGSEYYLSFYVQEMFPEIFITEKFNEIVIINRIINGQTL